MFCSRCGASNEESSRYCAECGAALPREGEAGEGGSSWRDRLAALAGRSRRERVLTVATVAAIAIAIVAFVALDTGDGGGGDRAATAELAAADAACVEAKRTIRRSARRALSSGEGGLEDYSADLLRAVVEFRSRVRTLGGGEGIERLDIALRELAIEAGALSRAAREDPEAVGDRLTAADAATAEVEAATTELGLDECSTVDLDPRALLATP